MRRGRAVLVATAAVLVSVGAPTQAGARASKVSGPTISLDRSELQPGQRVVATLSGWTARSVTLSVCGNLARRGSADCNVIASQTVKLVNPAAPTLTELVAFAPPTTCPCVIRASSAGQEEVVFAPIELAGVTVGPVVSPVVESPITVSVAVRAAPRGFVGAVRAALGGPTDHMVAVTVRNISAEALSSISLTGSAGRSRSDDAVSFDIPPPGGLAPGQTWEHEVRVTLPAPVLNRSSWRVIASGAGEAATTEVVARRVPMGFVILAAVFVVDVVAMMWHFTARRARRRPRFIGTEG